MGTTQANTSRGGDGSSLRAIILGAAAGGGLPQWNCGCRNCDDARNGRIPAMTQASVALSADGADWALINASPDIRQQVCGAPQLAPASTRHSPVKAVLVTNGDVDAVCGLLTLREKQPFRLYATDAIHGILAANPIFQSLDPEHVERATIRPGEPFEIVKGVQATLFTVLGKSPLYEEEGQASGDIRLLEGDQTVGVRIRCGGRTAHFIPSCAEISDGLVEELDGSSLLFFDGTTFNDGEMIEQGLGEKSSMRMGHVAISSEGGPLERLGAADIATKVFLHINNSNPILQPGSPERRLVEGKGWVVGMDSMEFAL